jgi:AcrR family transcriptional regulator
VTTRRERICHALAQLCAERGYAGDIVRAAGISPGDFAALYADKHSCLLDSCDLIVESAVAAVKGGCDAGSPPTRLDAGLRALLALHAADPTLMWLAMVEAGEAGEAALERRDAALRRFAALLTAAVPPADGQPLLARAVVGGLYEALYAWVRRGDGPPSASELTYCALVPCLGHAAALSAVKDPRA